jgi:hypothetical protein
MVDSAHKGDEQPEKQACDARVSRKEFLTKLVKRASIAGALLAAPQVIDKFLVPPAYAITSTTHTFDTATSCDTNKFADKGTSPFHDPSTTSPFHDTGTTPFHDTIDGCDRPGKQGQPDDFG